MAMIADFVVIMALEIESKVLDNETVLAGVNEVVEFEDYGFYIVATIDDKVVGCMMITYKWSD